VTPFLKVTADAGQGSSRRQAQPRRLLLAEGREEQWLHSVPLPENLRLQDPEGCGLQRRQGREAVAIRSTTFALARNAQTRLCTCKPPSRDATTAVDAAGHVGTRLIVALLLAASPLPALADCSGGFIVVGGKAKCLRKVTAEEAAAAYQQRRQIELREQEEAKAAQINRLKSLEQDAQRRVIDGYSPNVSIQEFQRRLDQRSDIQDSIRDLKYGQ